MMEGGRTMRGQAPEETAARTARVTAVGGATLSGRRPPRRLVVFGAATAAMLGVGAAWDRFGGEATPTVAGLPAARRPVAIQRVPDDSLRETLAALEAMALTDETRCRRRGLQQLGLVATVETPALSTVNSWQQRATGRPTIGAVYVPIAAGDKGGRILATADDRLTLAHEYVHAIDDQRSGRMALARRARSTDEQLALRAAIEGTAMAAVGTAPLRAPLTGDLDRNAWVLAYGIGPRWVHARTRNELPAAGRDEGRWTRLARAMQPAAPRGDGHATAAPLARASGAPRPADADGWLARALALMPGTTYEVLLGAAAPTLPETDGVPRGDEMPAYAQVPAAPLAPGERRMCSDGVGALGMLTLLRQSVDERRGTAPSGPRSGAAPASAPSSDEAAALVRAWRADRIDVIDGPAGVRSTWTIVVADRAAAAAWARWIPQHLQSARSAVLTLDVSALHAAPSTTPSVGQDPSPTRTP